jgi:hypothetical protein
MTVGVLLGKREHDDRQDEEKAHREPHERKVAIGLERELWSSSEWFVEVH